MDIAAGSTIAVWFSCGAASAVAAKKTIDKYGSSCTIRVLNNPVVEEDDDNQRFLKDVEKWIGVKIEHVISSKFPSSSAVDVWNARRFMSGPLGAPCTQELKKKARQEWEKNNKVDWHVLGFTAEEKRRHDRFVLTERSNLIPILIDGNITKSDCYTIIQSAGLDLPRVYKLGYPNANCIGCVKAGSATYWNHVRNVHPDIFQERAEQSRRIGTKLVYYKGTRIFLDELPADAKGRSMKNMDFECGIFCEEKK
jgi:hypothetical protein